MRPSFSLFALFASMASAAIIPRAPLTVSGPFTTGINCTTVYTWTGGSPPYTASFANIDTPGRVVVFESYPDLPDASLTWVPQNSDTGQMLRLIVNDGAGDEGIFQTIIVSTQIVCNGTSTEA